MASDAISSVAYAVEEILWILVIAVGLLAYNYLFITSIAIIVLLLILVFSYHQTIDSYPNGGGSYTVARENLGENSGLLAGASLIIDYILTVAVSTSSGTAAITSAIPALLPYKVVLSIFIILIMTIINLRGVRESAKVFAIPTYIFIFSMLTMIITGLIKVYVFNQTPQSLHEIPQATKDMTLFLMVRAFAAGCSGLSGVEAVSNAVPNFKDPSQKNAKLVLSLLALSVLAIFGGVAFLSTLYHAVPNHEVTVLSQIASQIFGNGIFFYVIQVATAVILIIAANTAYAGLPTLLSLMATDGYAPRQFSMRGIRLGYSNGILALSIAAAILVTIYQAQTHALVPLYSIGVFISFSLSQVGMLVKWIKSDVAGKAHKIAINGLGAIMTIVAVISIAYSKMLHGAWIAIVLMIILMFLMKVTSMHYKDIARQLKLTPEQVLSESSLITVQKHTIVVIGSINRASLKAINYARKLSDDKNIVAFHVSIDEDQSKKISEQWEKCNLQIPLIVKYSPYREIVKPLMEYVESEEHSYSLGDMLTVVMPQFVVRKRWQNLLHNQTAYAIQKKLLRDRHIAVITIPYVLDEK